MKKTTKILFFILILISFIMLIKVPRSAAATAKTKIWFDYPKQGTEYKKELNIHGWVMSELAEKTVKIYIDDKDITSQIKLYNRPDVTKTVKGFGTAEQNPLAGFDGTIDISGYKDGSHKVTVKVLENATQNVIQENTSIIQIKKYQTKIFFDYPKQSETVFKTINVHGWVMSEAENKTVQIFLDDTDITKQIKRYARPDVIKAVKNYGTEKQNPQSGFDGNVDISKLTVGKHTVKMKVINNDTSETIAEETRTINVRDYYTKIWFDYPKQNNEYKASLNVHGWIMSEQADKIVKFYIDNNDVTERIKRYARPDVTGTVKGFGTAEQNTLAGFDGTIDMSKYKDGKHSVTIKVLEKTTEREISQSTTTFTIHKYATKLHVDYPHQQQNSKNVLKIHGWVMSEQADKSMKFYLNNEDITSQIKLYDRPDVIKAIKNYGTAAQNPTAGYDGQIDVEKLTAGNYTLKIQVISNVTKEVLETAQVQITLNKILLEKGVYGKSGLAIKGDYRGSDLIYYKIGDGENVLFTTFSVHGYEDEWDQDGAELTKIAEQLKNKLIQLQDRELDKKWTIYIFPMVNPDGQKYGTTHNGPGRTTLYSAAPGHKGVDMNRCWSSNFEEKTNNRNYTGPEPFLAYEARYLRDFLLKNKSKTGQTILVDLHGWYNQSIGDEAVGKYYREQLGITKPHKSTYGTGYLVGWAKDNLGNKNYSAKSELIELVPVENQEEVASRRYGEKYITATINMLKGIL